MWNDSNVHRCAACLNIKANVIIRSLRPVVSSTHSTLHYLLASPALSLDSLIPSRSVSLLPALPISVSQSVHPLRSLPSSAPKVYCWHDDLQRQHSKISKPFSLQSSRMAFSSSLRDNTDCAAGWLSPQGGSTTRNLGIHSSSSSLSLPVSLAHV